jgi:LacI family repressor for deo operon, udp, cdd, tsx, nupC, and nupG
MAYGALRVLAKGGFKVGGDRAAGEVAVVGFDNHDLSYLFELSTVSQAVRELGRTAADLLMRRVAGSARSEQLVIPTDLRIRGTTGR